MDWHPYAEEWPLLKGVDPEGWEQFKSGIKATKGIADNPVRFRIADGRMQGLDGRNRFFACKELRIKPAMKKVSVSDDEVMDYIDRWNLHRRHYMTPELRQKLVAKRRELGQPIREIADALRVSKSTVARDIEATGATVPNGTVQSQDGIARPAQAPKLLPEVQAKFDASEISPRLRSDFEELTKQQQREALLLIQGGANPKTALTQVVTPDREPGCESPRRKSPKSGQVAYDWKPFNEGFGILMRQIDKLGNAFAAKESPEAEALRGGLSAWKTHFDDWYQLLISRQ
jgi:hypothetical protein